MIRHPPVAVSLALSLALGGCALFSRSGYEEPPYTVETARSEAFELRRYAARVVAETTVEAADAAAASSEGFRRLFKYISGENQSRQELSMTLPVGQRPAGQSIAMTIPVGQRREAEGRWVIAFTMPSGETAASLPVPNDARIVVRELPGTRFVVRRFSGGTGAEKVAEKVAELKEAAVAEGLVLADEFELNRFDPPLVPWFWRRNELWIAVVESEPGTALRP